eukprot:scaffold369_cov177-Ochromonas_danica.AAC.22
MPHQGSKGLSLLVGEDENSSLYRLIPCYGQHFMTFSDRTTRQRRGNAHPHEVIQWCSAITTFNREKVRSEEKIRWFIVHYGYEAGRG